jgi:glycosyltransferase involved in cell wall biosynthesis
VLSALLLADLFAAPLATAGLFLRPGRAAGRADGGLRQAGRLAGTLVLTLLLAVAVMVILRLLGVTPAHVVAGGCGLVLVSLLWLPLTRRWSPWAHVCWAATSWLFVTYLAFMLWWTFAGHLGPGGTAGGLVLWVLELAAAVLGGAYLWELCDTLGRASWRRRVTEEVLAAQPEVGRPFVSLHVPCYNEPPDMVIETLASLRQLDYPSFEIVVIDDNTEDEALWRPVEAWCQEHGVTFAHLQDWPGYKSGALNYARRALMDPRTELVGVIDSDYQIEPDFLRACAPLFADPQVGFIQAPQDYRDWEGAPFYRRLYYSYKYFFAVSQPSRNERDGAIFAGTMGLIRREALERVGGWDEWCITEDAELSLRILRQGWSGLHVDPSFGRGIMPLTFEALKGQRFRWCFGGIQILRRHWRDLVPGRRTERNHLDAGQRWAYLSGGIQWYGDLLALLFFAFLLIGAGNIAFSGGLLFRKLTGFVLAAIPVLVLLGLLRAVALLRRGTGASWRDALGAFGIWQSTSLTVARASVQALYAREAAFLRTPKTMEEAGLLDALRANWAETSLGLLGVVAVLAALVRGPGEGGELLAALLVWPTISFLAAPWNSRAAQKGALPAELQARRRTENLRYGTRRVSYAVGGLALTGALVTAAAALLVSGPAISPELLGPAQGHAVPTPAAGPQTTLPAAPAAAVRPAGKGPGSTTSGPAGGSSSTSTTTRRPTTTTRPPATTSTSTSTTTSTSTSTTTPTSSTTTTGPTAGR